MSEPLKLYFVADNSTEYNLDLFVAARTPEQAIDLWRTHWSDWVDETDEPERVFLVPECPSTPRTLTWHSDIQQEWTGVKAH